jgi:integrase
VGLLLRRKAMPPDSGAAVAAHLGHLRLRGLAATTIGERRRALARMAAILPVPLLQATEADLLAWRAGLHLGDYALNSYAAHARGFYGWAVSEGLIASNPAVGLPVPRRPKRLPRPVAEKDLLAALESAPPRVRLWLILAAYCGLRAREVAFLRREDILEHNQPPVLIVTEQAAKGRRERIVPMPAFVLAELAAAKLPSSGWAFVRHDGAGGPNAPWLISKLAGEALHRAGIPATLHQLRHRYGSQIYHLTRDLRLTQELLGHASPETAAGYAAWDKASAVAAAEALPAPLLDEET